MAIPKPLRAHIEGMETVKQLSDQADRMKRLKERDPDITKVCDETLTFIQEKVARVREKRG